MHRVPVDARLVHAVVLACLLGVGCNGPRTAAVYPVTGTLTVSGTPAAKAMVAFHPLNEIASQPVLPVATTGPDGTFRLMTYVAGDGAPAGDYVVTVVWPDDSQPRDECEDVLRHDRLGARYADPAKSPWHVTVGPGPNELPLQADAPAVDPSLPRGHDILDE